MGKAKKNDPSPKSDEPEEGEPVTTVKVYRSMARNVSQLAKLLETNQQEVMQEYAEQVETRLHSLIAQRHAEYSHKRKS